jgi:cytochrome c biogenesis protein CcdA
MKHKATLLLIPSLLLVMLLPTVQADEPVVRLLFFYSQDCEHCQVVIDEVLLHLQEKYGAQLEIQFIEISDPDSYQWLLDMETAYQIPPDKVSIPEVFVGETALIGETEIRERLDETIASYLAAGGVDYPPRSGATSATTGDAPLIHLAYFYQTGCQECDRVGMDLRYLQERYSLAVTEFDVREQSALNEWLGAQAGVPEENRLTAPAIFVGNDALIGQEINARSLETLVEKHAITGAPPTWEDFDPATAKRSIVERFKSLGVFTVAFAGLIDGLNPCAFATLVFFVSYLTLSGRKGRQVLAVGTAFTAGVFLAYLAVGLGFHHVLGLLGDLLTELGRWVYGLTAVLCAVLAVVSFRDFCKARQGDIGDMALNLPHSLRMRINAVIRRGRHSRAFVAGSFVTGILVSFLELACTGQVYLPTIIFVMSMPAMRVRAVLFLVLYNLLFIAPLVVVFALVWYGTTGTKQLTSFLQRHVATVKLGMALLFAGLAAWLVIALL